MKFIKLTLIDDKFDPVVISDIFIDPQFIASVANFHADGSMTSVIMSSGRVFHVKESVKEVVGMAGTHNDPG